MSSRQDQFPFTHFIRLPLNLPGYPTGGSENIFSQLLLHTLPPRRCLLPQFPQDLNKALTPMAIPAWHRAIPMANLPPPLNNNQFVPDLCSFH